MNRSPLKKWLVALAFLGTLVALFYAEEDWRGARELARVRKEVEAKGESLDPRALVPPPIPDALNVAAAPVFAELYEKDTPARMKAARLAPLIDFLKPRHDVAAPKFPTDEAVAGFSPRDWQKWLKGPADPTAALADVEAELEKLRPVADEVEAALARPGVRWPVTSPQNPFAERLPYVSPVLSLVRFFDLRALAEIEAGDGEAALHDLGVMLRLSEVVVHRFLVGQLVGISCDRHAYGVISWGLGKGAWNDSQLARIEAMLARKNHLADFREAIRQERLSAIRFYSIPLREQISLAGIVLSLSDNPPGPAALSWRQKALWAPFLLRPRGWQKLDEAYGIEMEQKAWIDSVDPGKGVVDVSAAEEAQNALKKDQESKWKFLVRPFSLLSLPALTATDLRAAATQTTLNEAKAACVIERQRLRAGAVPDILDALTIPGDPIGGGPLHYVREKGGYLLYSIGWNQKDDGGVIVRRLQSDRPDPREGDWVWASRPDLYKFVPAKDP